MTINHYTEWTIEQGEQDPFDVCVNYEIRVGCDAKTYGLPEHCYPAEDPEIEIKSVRIKADENNANAPEYHLSDDQYEALATYIAENHPEEDHYYDERI